MTLAVVTTPATAPPGASAAELRSLVAIQFGLILLHDLPLVVLMLALLVSDLCLSVCVCRCACVYVRPSVSASA